MRARVKKLLLFLTLPLYALDQATKALVLRHIAPDEYVPVIPGWFDSCSGTIRRRVQHAEGQQRVLRRSRERRLIALVIFWKRGAFADRLTGVAAALLAAGILGNLTDRLAHKFVVDFLLFDLHFWPANPWPAFNVADACICVAAGLFVIHSLFEKKDASREEGEAPAEPTFFDHGSTGVSPSHFAGLTS